MLLNIYQFVLAQVSTFTFVSTHYGAGSAISLKIPQGEIIRRAVVYTAYTASCHQPGVLCSSCIVQPSGGMLLHVRWGENNRKICGDSAEFSETKENLLKLRKHGPKPSSYNDIQKSPVLGRVGLKEVSPDVQHESFFKLILGAFQEDDMPSFILKLSLSNVLSEPFQGQKGVYICFQN